MRRRRPWNVPRSVWDGARGGPLRGTGQSRERAEQVSIQIRGVTRDSNNSRMNRPISRPSSFDLLPGWNASWASVIVVAADGAVGHARRRGFKTKTCSRKTPVSSLRTFVALNAKERSLRRAEASLSVLTSDRHAPSQDEYMLNCLISFCTLSLSEGFFYNRLRDISTERVGSLRIILRTIEASYQRQLKSHPLNTSRNTQALRQRSYVIATRGNAQIVASSATVAAPSTHPSSTY